MKLHKYGIVRVCADDPPYAKIGLWGAWSFISRRLYLAIFIPTAWGHWPWMKVSWHWTSRPRPRRKRKGPVPTP